MSLLTDRASALREFFRLVNADSSDGDLTEHDSSTLEGAYEKLAQGLEEAQLFLIQIGRGGQWRAQSSALTWAGTEPRRYAALPSDFLRLDSDPEQRISGLRDSSGRSWGSEIDEKDRDRAGANRYYVVDDATDGYRVYVTKGSAPPSNLLAEYYTVADALADSTDMDVPADARPLVPAFATELAKDESWVTGGDAEKGAVTKNLAAQKRRAFKRGRLTRRSRKVQTAAPVGRYIV